MAQNVHRLTASRILLVFAGALFIASLVALQIRLKREALEWVEFPTALGDTRHYEPREEDFYSPNLRFSEQPQGLHRRNKKAQERSDADMLAIDTDSENRYTIYTPRDRESDFIRPAPVEGRRYFLKVDVDRYIEFGEKKFYPVYEPPQP